jgi:glucans biosynthesis protein C
MQLKADRQYYLDWLRAGSMALLIFYHSGRLFNDDAWHLKNPVTSSGIDTFLAVIDLWQMPLFFLVAGAAVWYSMGNRSAGTFAKERLLRLFVPLIFGMLVLVPPQVYVERIYDGDFIGSFWAWYPHTFQGMYTTGNAAAGNLSWHHLWFLAYLFVFSMLLIPVFRYFRNEKRKPLLEKIAGFFAKPGAIFLPVIPLIIIDLTLRETYGYGNQNLFNDWANFLFYIFVFFYGFMMVSNPVITQAIKKQTWVSLGLLAVFIFLIVLLDNGFLDNELLLTIFYPIGTWLALLVWLGLGMRVLNSSNKLLAYANDAVLPVYILHQTIIVVFGYFVIQWDWPVAAKYPLVIAVTFAGSVLIYELVRHNSVTRFLFGIKARAVKKPDKEKEPSGLQPEPNI